MAAEEAPAGIDTGSVQPGAFVRAVGTDGSEIPVDQAGIVRGVPAVDAMRVVAIITGKATATDVGIVPERAVVHNGVRVFRSIDVVAHVADWIR